MSDGRRKGTLGYTNLGCAGAVAAGSGKRKINVAGKRLLEGVIRSVGSHNKVGQHHSARAAYPGLLRESRTIGLCASLASTFF